MSWETEFVHPGMEANSTLNTKQMSDFLNHMSRAVWQLTLQFRPRGQTMERTHQFMGVCFREDGLILTKCFPDVDVESITAKNVKGAIPITADFICQSVERGLAVVRVRQENTYHVKFGEERVMHAGQRVYSIFWPGQDISPIVVKGHLAYDYDPTNESDTLTCPKYQLMKNLTEYPSSLGPDVSILLIARTLVSNEERRSNFGYANKCGFKEARGSPLFNANGHLVGLIVFQQAFFDIAVAQAEIEELLKESLSDRKGKGKVEHGDRKGKGKGKGKVEHIDRKGKGKRSY